MTRYDYGEILKNKFGQRFYSTINYPTLPLSSNDIYILTENGDTLASIANKFWNDVNLWWVIPCINTDIPKDSFHLEAGLQLRIPDIDQFFEEFRKINS